MKIVKCIMLDHVEYDKTQLKHATYIISHLLSILKYSYEVLREKIETSMKAIMKELRPKNKNNLIMTSQKLDKFEKESFVLHSTFSKKRQAIYMGEAEHNDIRHVP